MLLAKPILTRLPSNIPCTLIDSTPLFSKTIELCRVRARTAVLHTKNLGLKYARSLTLSDSAHQVTLLFHSELSRQLLHMPIFNAIVCILL